MGTAIHPVWPGTAGPELLAPSRVPGSLRRVTSVDVRHVDVDAETMELRCWGRDVVTDDGGGADIPAEIVLEIASGPEAIDLRTLRGVDPLVVPGLVPPVHLSSLGLRRRIRQLAPALAEHAPLLDQVLDDVPVLLIVGRASLLRTGQIFGEEPAPVTDVCIGWRTGSLMVREMVEGHRTLLGQGPILPVVARPPEDADLRGELGPDEVLPALPPGSVRRARRMDLVPRGDGGRRVLAFFRDSYFEPDGAESVIHEYAVTYDVDGVGMVTSIAVTPHVLPGPECPAAVASVAQLVGLPADEILGHVRKQLRGPATCTHLSDTMAAIGRFDASAAGRV